MVILRWLGTLVAAGATGLFTVTYLTIHPLEMSLHLFLACLMLAVAVSILALGFRGRERILAVSGALVAFAGGYLGTAQVALAREDDREVPAITRAMDDPGDGHVAVVYFTHGEPQTYDPIGWLNQFREFDRQGITFVPLFARPFFLYQLRNAYLTVGASHHRQGHESMIQAVEAAFRDRGDDTTRFYLAFLDDDPRPDAAVIHALNEGASAIVVVEVFVSISNHTAEGEEMIREVRAEDYGVPVAFTGPLWDSSTLHLSFVEEADAAIGATKKNRVGVLLVGHGQPDEWDREWPTETEHELAFRRSILDQFVATGYPSENLGLAWMEFKQPKPAEQVEALVANGVEKIVYFSAAISADSIHSQYDTPELMHQAQVPDDILMINLGGWNDHPRVIQAIVERIDAFMPDVQGRQP
jgi:protoheme ferro-lyase